MQRRSFFGILGGIGAFLGLKSETIAKEQPLTDLPVIQFDERKQIANLEELFSKAKTVQLSHVRNFQIVKAWLNKEDVRRVCMADHCWVHYGPVILSRCSDFWTVQINPTKDSLAGPYAPKCFELIGCETTKSMDDFVE